MKALFYLAILVFLCFPAVTHAGGFPSLKKHGFASHRGLFDEDRNKLKQDASAFFAEDRPGIACDMTPMQQQAFVESAFMRDITWGMPAYAMSALSWDVEATHPIFDRPAIRLLEGTCRDGRIDGPATIIASFVAIQPKSQFGNRIFRIYEVKLKETCQYRASVRNGECRRAESAMTFLTYLNDDGFLETDPGLPATRITIFDYGLYADNRETGPGASFQSAELAPGFFKDDTLTRRKQGDSLRYETYLNEDRVIYTYFRRQSDLVLHGPSILVPPHFTCFEDGKKVERKECPEP